MTQVWDLPDLTQSETLVLLALADFSNDAGVSWPSTDTVARRARVTKRGAQKIVKRLEEAGLVTIDRSGGRGHTNTYRLCLELNGEHGSPLRERVNAGAQKGERGDVKGEPDDVKGEQRSSPDPIEPSGTLREPSGARTRATRLPDDFELTPERRLVAEAERLPAERTFEKFCDYWRSASGQRARKHDWDATWRNWCRTEADRSRGSNRTGGTHVRKPTAIERARRATGGAAY